MSLYDECTELYELFYGNIKTDIPFYLGYAQQKGSPVLEIACGTGRVLIPLAEAGYEVWGIDFSSKMLAKAQQKTSALPENVGKKVHLVQADMRNFNLDIRFPLALIPFRSFLLLLTVEDQIQTLENIRKHLKDDGILIIDLSNPLQYFSAQDQRQIISKVSNPENKHIIFKTSVITYDYSSQLMGIDYIFDEYDEKGNSIRRFHRSAKHRYIFRYEMEHLLKLSRFKLEAIYGTFDKKPYDYRSREMIFVANIV